MLSGDEEDEDHFRRMFDHLKMIKTPQRVIYLNFPTDKTFGGRLLRSLGELFDEHITNLHREIGAAPLQIHTKAELINAASTLRYTHAQVDNSRLRHV